MEVVAAAVSVHGPSVRKQQVIPAMACVIWQAMSGTGAVIIMENTAATQRRTRPALHLVPTEFLVAVPGMRITGMFVLPSVMISAPATATVPLASGLSDLRIRP